MSGYQEKKPTIFSLLLEKRGEKTIKIVGKNMQKGRFSTVYMRYREKKNLLLKGRGRNAPNVRGRGRKESFF